MHRRGIVALPDVHEAREACCCVSRSSWVRSLQASSVRTLLPRLAHTAGIEKHVHPHGLCHTCDAELTMERMLVHVIHTQLRHASLQ
jgi:site-specific recombinase XerD